MRERKKSQLLIVLFFAIILTAIAVSSDRLFLHGVFAWHMEQKEYRSMMAETALLFCLFCAICGIGRRQEKRWIAAVGIGVTVAIFLWGHAVFVPVIVSGLYLLYVMAVGQFVKVVILRLPKEVSRAGDFLIGSLTVIVVFCLMSAVGAGAIPYLQGFVVSTAAALLVRYGSYIARHIPAVHSSAQENLKTSWYFILSFSFILTMFCIQAGRMNIAVDFDSLWYGVRAPYILDNGNGIYENLGTIGIVYTYSKGFEVLTLPLSTLPSYSFLLSVNLWLTAGVLWISYQISGFFVEKKLAVLMIVLLAATPGIMNMGITAKSDTATLFFQSFLFLSLLEYIVERPLACVKGKRENEGYGLFHLAMAAASFFLTWTLKPTALVFSTAIAGMSFLFFLWKRRFPVQVKNRWLGGSLGLIALSILALAGIWARTLLITGLPVTSVFSSLLTQVGMEMKYPFHISRIPNNGADISLLEGISAFGKRLWGFLVAPTGVDMEHVILAWGGFLLLFLLITGLMCLFLKKKNQGKNQKLTGQYLTVVYVPFLLVNLVSLSMLGQVDGNYFMLLYVLTAVFVFRQLGRVKEATVQRNVAVAAVPVLLFLTVTTALTNWSWTLGFTPLSFSHPGYYNHLEIKRQEMADKGNGMIWDMLAAEPQTRVIAVGDHPQTLAFPCNVQSYDDITGSWGNVILVKTMDLFVEFLNYAKTDYVYVQSGYMAEDQRCYSLVRTLIEYGKLEPVYEEQGNVLAAVVLDGERTDKSVAALTEFDNSYIKRE